MLGGVLVDGAANEQRQTAGSPLMEAASAWVRAQRATAPADRPLFLPLDSRTALATCPAGWRFDLPFSDPQALRAVCAEPRLQIFLRATIALRAADDRAAVRAAPTTGAAVPATSDRTPPSAPVPAPVPVPVPVPIPVPVPAGEAAGGSAVPGVVAGRSRQWLALRQDLRRGSPLGAQSVNLASAGLPLQRGLGEPIEDASTLEHMELVRDKLAGQVLYTHDIQPTLLVRRGQFIAVTMQAVPGLTITARLEALQDGRIGETVRLRNLESGRIVSAVVVGPNAARLP